MQPLFFNNVAPQGSLNQNVSAYEWYISADKIFHSDVDGLEDFAKFFGMEFHISKFSLFDGIKSSDSAVLARDVKIFIGPGSHCAMIQGRLAKGVAIPKIIVKKTAVLIDKIEALETKEFFQCILQSFSTVGETNSFSFRYASYADNYTDFNEEGKKLGTVATKIDLAKWEVEES
ncbi:MAG: hypothetical protein LBO02_00740 [Holosporaceae bacterium]|jgi:hypothetical protein|nr:hypothetical protein [Holosporaceae bacterium]